MYATLTDLLFDLFGINIPLPIQTFGFFMALSFAAAYYTTMLELKRKEMNGLIHAFNQQVTLNKPITWTDIASSVVFGALIGYKLVYMFMNYKVMSQNPQAFILSLDGSWLGLLLGAGVAFYFKYNEQQATKQKQITVTQVQVHPYQLMSNVVGIAALAGLLGAKLFHNLENLDEFFADPMGALFSFSGLTFYGGLIVATYAVLSYTSRNHIPSLHMIDAAAPGLILAYGIGRIGCHLSGDGDWGIAATLPKPEILSAFPDWFWSFSYPHNVINEGIPIPGCDGNHCFQLAAAVYPTPLYESVLAIFIFIVLWVLRKHISVPGMLFSVYLILNGTERFFIEQIRVNSTYHIFGKQITQAELIASALILIGIAGIFITRNFNKNRYASTHS
jgi:prolipoprotein diacylglyceryl transferase